MINTTKDQVLFLKSGNDLRAAIVTALEDSCRWIRQSYGLEDINLADVSTKTYLEAALPAHVDRFILNDRPTTLDEQYVRDVQTFVNLHVGHCPLELYAAVTKNPHVFDDGRSGYRKSYLTPLRRGFSVFLAALHIRRALVLPFSFQWPRGYEKDKNGRVLSQRELCPLSELPELLRLFRSIDYKEGAHQTEEVFRTYTAKQRERLVSAGQRLVIAAGWLQPEDANYNDLLALKQANDANGFAGGDAIGLALVVDLLKRRYAKASPVDGAGWGATLANSKSLRAIDGLYAVAKKGNDHLLEAAIAVQPSAMAPSVMAEMNVLPGLDFDLKKHASAWFNLENTYLSKIRKESKKADIYALGQFNAYLFGYLPYWYELNRDFEYEFPSSPSRLSSAVFISDLGLLEGRERPTTFVEFLGLVARARRWGNNYHQRVLKQVGQFFEFIERYNDVLSDAKDFRQPLHQHDFPIGTGSTGTNKRPIPRRVFKLYLSYIESLIELAQVLTERVVRKDIEEGELNCVGRGVKIVDCFKHQELFGFVPIVFHNGKTYPIWQCHNVFFVRKKLLKDGSKRQLPHPHALHQILVSLYAGLRQNHIQWLDTNSFDAGIPVDISNLELAQIFVNTDKTMNEGWKPVVNIRVTEVLRQQRAWRNLIGEPGFENSVPYNCNPESKWGSFLPLFAYSPSGSPHSDDIYRKCWYRLLAGLQTLLGDVGELGIQLIWLLPRGVEVDAIEIDKKLSELGHAQNEVCEVEIKSNITPHSARVSVVSHTISILPANVIGKNWTGQSEMTVYQYVAIDEDELHWEQQHQHHQLRNIGHDQGYEAMLKSMNGQKGSFIKADDVNSSLSISLRSNVEETIASFGCISMTSSDQGRSGIDVLRETRGVGAVVTKTEICPFARQCPAEVVEELKGWQRCGPCRYAVRSIDHLPAVAAKIRQVLEVLEDTEVQIHHASQLSKGDDSDLNDLEEARDQLAADLAAWQLTAEVLEIMRRRIASGESVKTWYVRTPDIIEQHLTRLRFPSETTEYLLARLRECEMFPSLESAQVRARFDMLRRQLLANSGNIRKALSFELSPNPAAECLGMLRAIVLSHKLSLPDVKQMLNSDTFLNASPGPSLKLLDKLVA